MSKIVWSRVGRNYEIADTELEQDIDLEAIEAKVKSTVGGILAGDFDVKVLVRVKLDGGPFAEFDFGEGALQ